MRSVLIGMIVLGLFGAVTAAAQRSEPLEEGDFAPDLEAKEWVNVESSIDVPSLVELRGMVVVIFFWQNWTEAGSSLLPYINQMEHAPGFGRQAGIFTMGLTDSSRRTMQDTLDKTTAPIFFPIGCGSDTAEEYGINSLGFVVLDPDGKIAFIARDEVDIDGAVKAMRELLAENPPNRAHPEEISKVSRLLGQARGFIKEGDFELAFRRLRSARDRAFSVIGGQTGAMTIEHGDLMERIAYDKLEQARRLYYNNKEEEATALLRTLIADYPGLRAYYDAKATWDRLKKDDDDFADAVSKYEDEDSAARLLLDARRDLRERKFGESHEKLAQLLNDYPKTEAAPYAREMIERMKANPVFWGYVQDFKFGPECRELLARARTLLRQRNYREAERLFRRVMVEFEGTTFADEAREELIKMPRRR